MNDATQTGVAMATIGMIGTVTGLIVGLFRDRDKLRYDNELSGLRTQNAAQAKQMADQDTEIAVLKRTHQECEQQHAETARRLTQIELALATKKDRTDSHQPV